MIALTFPGAEHVDVGGIVPVAEHRVLDHFHFGLRVNAGFLQRFLDEKFDKAAAVR